MANLKQPTEWLHHQLLDKSSLVCSLFNWIFHVALVELWIVFNVVVVVAFVFVHHLPGAPIMNNNRLLFDWQWAIGNGQSAMANGLSAAMRWPIGADCAKLVSRFANTCEYNAFLDQLMVSFAVPLYWKWDEFSNWDQIIAFWTRIWVARGAANATNRTRSHDQRGMLVEINSELARQCQIRSNWCVLPL